MDGLSCWHVGVTADAGDGEDDPRKLRLLATLRAMLIDFSILVSQGGGTQLVTHLQPCIAPQKASGGRSIQKERKGGAVKEPV